MEEWRPVVGHEGSYEVSNHGNVRSLDRIVDRPGPIGPMRRKGKLLRQSTMRRGHLTVTITAGNTRLVHSLVAEAFIGPYPDGMEVRHLNGNPADNRIENLAYATGGENRKDIKFHAGKRGSLKVDQIIEVKRRLALGHSQRAIAKDFSVVQQTVSKIARGIRHADVN